MSESSEEAAIDNAMKDLKVSNLERQPIKPQYRETRPQPAPQRQYTRPQYQNPSIIAHQPPKPASYTTPNPTRPRIPNQYQRTPTMAIANPRSKRTRGGAKMHFRSHYGTGGEHLDTRTKSILLYQHCFG